PARTEGREPLEAHADRLDAFRRVIGALEEGQRQDRRDLGYGCRRRQAARLEQLERLRVAVFAQLELPDADAVETGGDVQAYVVGEARPGRRDLRDRD